MLKKINFDSSEDLSIIKTFEKVVEECLNECSKFSNKEELMEFVMFLL